MRRDAEELFEVFDMWTELETAPWEPPTPASRSVARPVLSPPHWTPNGAIEPATVIQAPPSMQQGRRRIGPRIPPPLPLPPPEPDPVLTPGDFLREVGIPEIERAAQRLEAVDHQLKVQDLLDLPDPALRVLFWPRPGSMNVDPERTRATLEISVQRDEPAKVVAHYWGDLPSESTVLGQIPLDTFDLDWLNARMLDFIEAVLGQV